MLLPGSLQGIQSFVVAVEAGGFTAAAERLGITKSAVGKAVAQLEQRLGVSLVNRGPRGLAVTSEGEAYFEACQRALAEIDAAQSVLASRRQVPSGRLRVDLPLVFGRRCVAPVLFELSERYPDLSVEMTFGDRFVDLIREGVDLVVRMGDLGDSAGLIARKLFVQRSALCASPAYLARRGAPAEIDDLAGHALIAYGRDGATHPWTLSGPNGKLVSYRPRSRLVMGHGEPMLDAALAGCGIAWLPTWLAEDALARGDLVPVLEGRPVENLPVHAVWPVTRNLQPRIRVVVDELVARCARLA